jgi:hypothetical protein
MRYRIAWRNKENGFTGHGGWLPMSEAIANQIAEDANRNVPIIHHWAESEPLSDWQRDILKRVNGNLFLSVGLGKGELLSPSGEPSNGDAVVELYRP